MKHTKVDLTGLNKEELFGVISPLCENNASVRMRVSQIWDWMYTKGETDFMKMTNMSKFFRSQLIEKFIIGRPEIKSKMIRENIY